MLAYAPAYTEPPPPATEVPARPFDTQAQLGYGIRNVLFDLDGAKVEGLADNALGLGGRFRAGDWLLGASGWRLKAPVLAKALSAVSNPALAPEISELRAEIGYVLCLPPLPVGGLPLTLAAAPGIALISHETAPGGSGLPVTGTPLDFTQARRGLGALVPAIASLGDIAEIEVRGALFPGVSARLEKAPYRFLGDSLYLAEGGVALRVKILGGLDAELGTGFSAWLGHVELDASRARYFKDLASSVQLGLVYRPERVGR